jgi:hypothetical protein
MVIMRWSLDLFALLAVLRVAPALQANEMSPGWVSSGVTFGAGAAGAEQGHVRLEESSSQQQDPIPRSSRLRLLPTESEALPWYGVGADWEKTKDSAPWGKREGLSSMPAGQGMVVLGGRVHDGTKITYKNDMWYSTDGAEWVQPPNSHSACRGRDAH